MKGNNVLFLTLIFSLFAKIFKAQNCGTPDANQFGTTLTVNGASPYWSTVPGATSYNFEYRIRNSGASWSTPISTNSPTLLLSNLLNSTNYEFHIQSVCLTDTSSFSITGSFTTSPLAGFVSLTRGPYMTVAKSNSVTIQWKTDISCNSEITYGTSLASQDKSKSTVNASLNHSITLNNLTPNTKYYYSIGTIGSVLQSSGENFFYTAPSDNDSIPLRFWVTGDFGNGSSAQLAVKNSFENFTSGEKINGWLWLGDNAYSNGTDQEYQTRVFDIYPNQFKNIPVFPAPGNHDYHQSGYQSTASLGTNFPYFSIFSIPTNSGTEKYYSTNYGNVHFIALDSYGSYNSSSSDMYHWLEDDLSNNTQQWTVVYFHHAPYSKGSHNSDDSPEMYDMRNNILPILESNGVDLVLSGHSHAYERSKFIKGHFGVENTYNSSYEVQPGAGPYTKSTRTGPGTIYAVCGVSGETGSTVSGYPHDAMQFSDVSDHGSLILDFSGTSLTGQFLTSSGTIKDNFTITKPAMQMTNNTIETANNKDADFEIYPNPVNTELNISLKEINDKTIKMKIYNVAGQIVFEKARDNSQNKNSIKINRNEIVNCYPGMYFITIIDSRRTYSKSIIIN